MKLTTSSAKTTPKPRVETISPETAGPATSVRPLVRPSKAFASWRRAALTIFGKSPVEAGLKKAEAQPKIAEATASCQIWMLSVKKAAAISPWTKARTRSAAIITSWRGSRSAQTPPTTRKRTRPPHWLPSTIPRSVAFPNLRTAKVSATGTTASPTAERVRPRKSNRNGRSRSGSSEAGKPLTLGSFHAGEGPLPVAQTFGNVPEASGFVGVLSPLFD
jgi:hypothetical protein